MALVLPANKNLTVVFFSDRWMLYGLHAALASLLAHAKRVRLDVIVFSDGLTKREKKLLEKTAAKFQGGHSFEIRDLNLQWPEGTPTLQGNLTALARVCLPSLLPDHDQVLYLDSDLIVQRDVGGLLETGDESPIKVVCEPSLLEGDEDFEVIRANIANPENASRMFNSGVFLASLAQWRGLDVQQRCVDLFARLSGKIRYADQTVLNIVFYWQWHELDSSWQTLLRPDQSKVPGAEARSTIWHFLSAPKPWYPLERFGSENAGIWRAWHKKTALARSPLSWVINYLTPRRMYITFIGTTLRKIAARVRKIGREKPCQP